jgi:hypothetical protein
MLFVAVHESLDGTFETCEPALKLSVHRGRPEVIGARPNDANDPTRTSASFEHSFEPHRPPKGRVARRSAAINHTEASRGERATVNAHLRLLHDR